MLTRNGLMIILIVGLTNMGCSNSSGEGSCGQSWLFNNGAQAKYQFSRDGRTDIFNITVIQGDAQGYVFSVANNSKSSQYELFQDCGRNVSDNSVLFNQYATVVTGRFRPTNDSGSTPPEVDTKPPTPVVSEICESFDRVVLQQNSPIKRCIITNADGITITYDHIVSLSGEPVPFDGLVYASIEYSDSKIVDTVELIQWNGQ